MDKNNLIKDTLIFANIISLMTKATNRCISKNSESLSGVVCEINPGSIFHASTLSDMLSLPMEEEQPQEPEVQENVEEEEEATTEPEAKEEENDNAE